MGTGELNAGGNPAMDQHPIQGGVEIFLVALCYRNRDKLRPGRPFGSYADYGSGNCTSCNKSRSSNSNDGGGDNSRYTTVVVTTTANNN